MPQENLIVALKNVLLESNAEVVCIPRINIHPGSTQNFYKWVDLPVNEFGWINWPDYQGRIIKNNGTIEWTKELHTKPISDKVVKLHADPQIALWHIKAVEKQESRWDESKSIASPTDKNLYDLLM